MAKKKKKEEKYEFKIPEFDEIDYMKKEMESAKVAIITIAFAIPVALLSYLLTLAGVSIIAFFVGILGIFCLRYLYPLLRIRTEDFDKKTWLGNAAMMFFTWLAFWVLLLNPPFTDLSRPTITEVKVSVGNNWMDVKDGGSIAVPLNGNSSADITVRAIVTDNVGIRSVNIIVRQGENPSQNLPMNPTPRNVYVYEIQDAKPNDSFIITIEAIDTSGRFQSFSFRATVVA